jgi:ABC-type transport system substrate-binding protein
MAAQPVFTYGVSEPLLSLNPFSGTGFSMWQAHQLIFDFLLFEVPGQRDQFRSALAKKWTISQDKKTFEFELRSAVWSDGRAVTAEDVKFSIEHIFDKKFNSIWTGTFEGVEKVEIVGPLKIKIIVKEPQFELWKSLAIALKIIPKHFYAIPDSMIYNKQALGSGPYKIANFESGQKFTLNKNSKWWGWKDPELRSWYTQERIKFLTLSDISVAPHFQKHELDLMRVTNSQLVKTLKQQNQLEINFILNPNKNSRMVEQIIFNLKNPLFSNLEIRKALNYIVERKNLCAKSYDNGSTVGETNVKKAQQILRKNGFADSDKDGVLEKEGKLLAFTVIYSSTDYEVMLSKLKESLRSFGVAMNLQRVDYSLMQKTLNDKKFDAYIDRFDENQTVLRSVWDTRGAYNYTGFSNNSIDKSLKEMDKVFDVTKRNRLIKSMRKEIANLQPSLTLCEVKVEDFISSKSLSAKNLKKGIQFWGWFSNKKN